MTGRELDRLRDKHSSRVMEHLARYLDSDDSTDVPDGIDDLTSTSVSDAPGSIQVVPPSYLSLRISGEAIRQGSIDTELFDDIVVPFQGELKAASKDSSITRLDLISITSGSTVLHFQPRLISPASSAHADSPEESPSASSSIERVLDTHDLIERRASGANIRADTTAAMLESLSRLTAGLVKHDAELEVLWRPGLGRRRPSRLGRDGVAHAQGLFERRETTEAVEVFGYVYSLSLTGQIVLKRNATKKYSATNTIEFTDGAQILSQFSLNDFVRLNVMRTSTTDELGRTISTHHRFVSVAHHQPQLGGEPPPGLDDIDD